MFSLFNLSRKKRSKLKLNEPKAIKNWFSNLLSEFVGTFILALLFSLLTIVLPNDQYILDYFNNVFIIAMYAGFFVIAIVLIIFLRWSGDVNPAITLYRILSGRDTYRYGFSKIGVQFLASIVAGVVLYFSTADIIRSSINVFEAPTNAGFFGIKIHTPTAGFSWSLFIEVLLGASILWPIFNRSVNPRYYDFMVPFFTFLAVPIGLLGGSITFNSARALAQQWPAIFSGQMNTELTVSILGSMTGNLLSPFILIFLQGLFGRHVNDWFVKMIVWKSSVTEFVPKNPKKTNFKKKK